MELTEADQIWNRAALESGGSRPSDGDRSLAALLLAHGMVMNGGVGHAIEVLSAAEIAEAAAGFRYFSFNEVGQLLEDAVRKGVDDSDVVDQRYAQFIPDDGAIVDRFRAILLSSPSAFSPL